MIVLGNIIRLSAAFLVLLMLVLPRTALAQHSAAATVNVVFAVLPVHTGAPAAAVAVSNSDKVTVSLGTANAGIDGPATQSGPHMLVTTHSPLIRPPRGSLLLVTVTE